MFVGVLFILAACLCWSLIFIIPEFLLTFSPFEISLGRFFFFGFFSVVVLLAKRRDLFHKSYWPAWKKACLFGFISMISGYTFTVFCIQRASPETSVLLFGTVPIIIALLGNWRQKEYSFRFFWIPCICIGLGMGLVNRGAFLLERVSLSFYLFGVILGVTGVACWVWYVISCFDFMKKNKQINSVDWILILGSVVFCLVVFVSCGFFLILENIDKHISFPSKWPYFLLGSSILGVISSWCALYCWTQGNLRLPISLVGLLSIFELVFGLMLSYFVLSRGPGFLEVIGIALMIIGVFYGFHVLKKLPAKGSGE